MFLTGNTISLNICSLASDRLLLPGSHFLLQLIYDLRILDIIA